MKKYERVNNKEYFNKIIKEGPSINNKYFVVHNLKTNNYNFKSGIAVGKTIGKAHIRNKLKRQVRAIIDSNRFIFQNYQDYIIIVKKPCLNENYEVLVDSLVKLMEGRKK